MNVFLTPEELSQLTGYQPNQRARICHWLTQNGIAHHVNRLGEPVVVRSQLDPEEKSVEPDFDAIRR